MLETKKAPGTKRVNRKQLFSMFDLFTTKFDENSDKTITDLSLLHSGDILRLFNNARQEFLSRMKETGITLNRHQQNVKQTIKEALEHFKLTADGLYPEKKIHIEEDRIIKKSAQIAAQQDNGYPLNAFARVINFPDKPFQIPMRDVINWTRMLGIYREYSYGEAIRAFTALLHVSYGAQQECWGNHIHIILQDDGGNQLYTLYLCVMSDSISLRVQRWNGTIDNLTDMFFARDCLAISGSPAEPIVLA